MRIVYVGSLDKKSNSYGRFKTLTSMGHETSGIDVDSYIYKNLFTKFHHHLNIGPGIFSLNNKVVESITDCKPDLLWIDNKSFLTVPALKKIRTSQPGIKIINLITDDATGRLRYAWRLCLRTAKYYDCHFVQRTVNIQELKKYGAKKVELCYRSFDPQFHRPILLNEDDRQKYKTSVGFIGTYESIREEYIAFLLKNNIPVSITGNGWPAGKYWNLIRPYYKGPSIYGEEYIKAINGMDIALHFLRHGNRDEQDSRTFEIPGCGVFMMAESSKLHLQLFEKNEEAVFFTSKEELVTKVNFYREHVKERNRIAENGYKKSFEGGYTHEDRIKLVIEKIFAQ